MLSRNQNHELFSQLYGTLVNYYLKANKRKIKILMNSLCSRNLTRHKQSHNASELRTDCKNNNRKSWTKWKKMEEKRKTRNPGDEDLQCHYKAEINTLKKQNEQRKFRIKREKKGRRDPDNEELHKKFRYKGKNWCIEEKKKVGKKKKNSSMSIY